MDLKAKLLKEKMLHNYYLMGLCCFIIFALSGCFENYGRLHWNPQVTSNFQNNTVEKDFKYYHYGIGNRTFAIAGVAPEYNIKSRIWREVPKDTEALEGFVSRAWINHAYKPYHPQGAFILDPAGQQVGTWYSSLRFVTVRFNENKRIELMPDTPFLGGPSAGLDEEFGERTSRFESNPYISEQLKTLLASQ